MALAISEAVKGVFRSSKGLEYQHGHIVLSPLTATKYPELVGPNLLIEWKNLVSQPWEINSIWEN